MYLHCCGIMLYSFDCGLKFPESTNTLCSYYKTIGNVTTAVCQAATQVFIRHIRRETKIDRTLMVTEVI